MSEINKYKPCCLKNKIFEKGSKIDIICRFISYYMIIVGVAIVFYTLLVPYDKYTPSDVINLFVWGTYIMAPMVIIWTYDSWKEQHNKAISSEMLKDTVNKLIINRYQLFHQIYWFKDYFSATYKQQHESINLFKENYIILCRLHDELAVNLSTTKFILYKDLFENKYEKYIGEFIKLNFGFIECISRMEDIMQSIPNSMNETKYKEHCDFFICDVYQNNQVFYVIEYLENIIHELKSEMEAK